MPRKHQRQKPTTVYLPRDVHRSLKIEAAQRGMSFTAIVLEALSLRRAVDDPLRASPLGG